MITFISWYKSCQNWHINSNFLSGSWLFCFLLVIVYSTDRSKAVVPVLILHFVALWFILRGDLFYVLPCVILFLCYSVLLVLRLPRLWTREKVLVLFIRFFDLRLFGFVCFLFLLVSRKGCGLWLWHSLDFSLTFFVTCVRPIVCSFWGLVAVRCVECPVCCVTVVFDVSCRALLALWSPRLERRSLLLCFPSGLPVVVCLLFLLVSSVGYVLWLWLFLSSSLHYYSVWSRHTKRTSF